MPSHRNSQKRIYEPGRIYFTVSKTFQNYPYFKEPILCELLIEELRLCKKLHSDQFNLLAFSIIYDHLNLMVQSSERFDISKIMQYIKKQTSRNINYILGYNQVPLQGHEDVSQHEGDNDHCRLHVEKHPVALIKEFVVRLEELKKQFWSKAHNHDELRKFKWQKSFHDHIIRDEKDYWAHYRYTIYNPQKHQLPEDWKYTSSNYIDNKELVDVAWW